jgi:hypothetical protein
MIIYPSRMDGMEVHQTPNQIPPRVCITRKKVLQKDWGQPKFLIIII